MNNVNKRNITIEQARMILGENHSHHTDEQILSVLDFMYKMAEMELERSKREQTKTHTTD